MSFSYSAVDTAFRCFKKYELQYLLKEPAKIGSYEMSFGTAIHLALGSLFMQHDELESVDPVDLFVAKWGMVKSESPDLSYGRFSHSELLDKGKIFISKFIARHAKHYKPVYVEKRIKGLIGEHTFEGTPDFIGEYKGVLSMVDFKTSNYRYTEEKIISNEQMYIYAELARQTYGIEIKQLVYPVFIKNKENTIQTMTLELTANDLSSRIDNVIKKCDIIKALKSYPKNSNSCMIGQNRCPYWEKCYGTK